MKTGYIFLPFVALLVGAVGTVVGSSLDDSIWITAMGWAAAVAILIFWVTIDLDYFKRLFTEKSARFGLSNGALVLVGLAVIIGIASLTSRPRFNKSFDVTRDSLNTLSDQSLKIVQELASADAQVKVLGFFQDESVKEKFQDLVALYLERGADLSLEYLNPQTELLRAKAEKITSGNTVVLKLGDQENRLTTFNEEKFTNGLVNLLKTGTKKVYFTVGHGEGEIKGVEANGFNNLVEELKATKFEVEPLQLLEQAKVPEDASLVIVGGPKYDFKAEELRFLEEYLKNGGAALVLLDAITPIANINKVISKFGVTANTDLLILSPNDERAMWLGQNNAIVTSFDEFSAVTRDFAAASGVAMFFQNTRSLTINEDNPYQMKVLEAAKTPGEIIRVKDVSSEADLKNVGEDRVEQGEFPVLVVATGKAVNAETAAKDNSGGDQATDVSTNPKSAVNEAKEVRLVVAGSSAFARNAGSESSEHRDLFLNIVNFLSKDENLISIRPKDPTQSTLAIMENGGMIVLLLLCVIYPFVFLFGGIVYWGRRKNA